MPLNCFFLFFFLFFFFSSLVSIYVIYHVCRCVCVFFFFCFAQKNVQCFSSFAYFSLLVSYTSVETFPFQYFLNAYYDSKYYNFFFLSNIFCLFFLFYFFFSCCCFVFLLRILPLNIAFVSNQWINLNCFFFRSQLFLHLIRVFILLCKNCWFFFCCLCFSPCTYSLTGKNWFSFFHSFIHHLTKIYFSFFFLLLFVSFNIKFTYHLLLKKISAFHLLYCIVCSFFFCQISFHSIPFCVEICELFEWEWLGSWLPYLWNYFPCALFSLVYFSVFFLFLFCFS